jgi:ketopantoate reductase
VTDASQRFERGVDPAGQERAVERATALLIACAGGVPGPTQIEQAAPRAAARKAVEFRPDRARTVIGAVIEDRVMSTILTALGMRVDSRESTWTVTPPSWRFDITIEDDLIEEVARMLNAAGIETRVVADPMAQIWSKFVLNCAINALTAVTGLRSGEMYRTPEVNALQDRVIDEILEVVGRKGIKLAEPDPRKKIKAHCRIRYNRPSMMQHMEQGRRTEIDALNGALVREAKALGIPVPYNEAVVAVVKGMEKSRRQLLHEPPRDYKKLEAEAEAEARADVEAGGTKR